MVTVQKIIYHGETRILFTFPYDENTLSSLKKISGIRYSKTRNGWHTPYTPKTWSEFKTLGLPHIIRRENNSDSDAKDHQTDSEKLSQPVPQPTGTASPNSAKSDNAGIMFSNHRAHENTVVPSIAVKKDTDIRIKKSGREVLYSGGNFVITMNYHAPDVTFLKSLKGWWNAKAKKWIIRANEDSLFSLQHQYAFWDEETFNGIHDVVLQTTHPYVVTLFQMPDDKKSIFVQISGHKANIYLIQRISDRIYLKDNRCWQIPNHIELITRIEEQYVRDGAIIINRLPNKNFDYQKKKPSYGDWKKHWLKKTEESLREIVSAYIDALSAKRYSLRTFDVYLGPFIRFVKHVGQDNIKYLESSQIDQYLSILGAAKVSDAYLHNAVNAIKFYYSHVSINSKMVIPEIKRPKKGKLLPTILSVQEIDRILRAIENLKHITLLYTLYSSGMRLNEILHLRTEDIWWDRDQIMIKNGKGKKDRIVPLSQVLKSLLLKYYESYKPVYWLFEGQDRTLQYSERSLQNVVKKAAAKAGIFKKVSPHTIRHCFATHLLDGGTDVRYIQELLGHANITTTLIYTHVTNQKLNTIESPLDKLLRGREDQRFFKGDTEKPES